MLRVCGKKEHWLGTEYFPRSYSASCELPIELHLSLEVSNILVKCRDMHDDDYTTADFNDSQSRHCQEKARHPSCTSPVLRQLYNNPNQQDQLRFY